MTEYDKWVIDNYGRVSELCRQKIERQLTPLECLEILEIHLTGKDWDTNKPYNKYEYEIKKIRKALKESEKQ